jgi:hypothetical protein
MSEWKQRWRRVPKWARIIGMVVIGMVTAAVLGLVFGIYVRELWNMIMPDLFGLKTITYWQAFGIVILGHLIFGGAGGGHSESKSSKRRKHHDSCGEEDDFKEDSKHWKYYDEWWSSQGKQAFTDYAEKKAEENGTKSDNQ